MAGKHFFCLVQIPHIKTKTLATKIIGYTKPGNGLKAIFQFVRLYL